MPDLYQGYHSDGNWLLLVFVSWLPTMVNFVCNLVD